MKKALIGLIASIALVCGVLFPSAAVYAGNNVEYDAFSSICEDASVSNEVKERAGCGDSGTGLGASKDPVFEVATNLFNAVIGITGTVAFVFMLIGGINFMTATGDPGKIKKAKDTILYSAIGLVVCIISAAVVNWIIAKMILGY